MRPSRVARGSVKMNGTGSPESASVTRTLTSRVAVPASDAKAVGRGSAVTSRIALSAQSGAVSKPKAGVVLIVVRRLVAD